jgi:hypothetical protein
MGQTDKKKEKKTFVKTSEQISMFGLAFSLQLFTLIS